MVRKAAASPSPDPGGKSPDAGAASFEDAIGELESLVQRMESGSLSLEESLAAYRRGAELVASCRATLASAQQQVKVLEGELLRPFEVDGDADAE